MLRDALGGNSKTVMIANVWPLEDYIEETVTTLRFGTRVRALTTNAVINESDDPYVLLRRYERQIKELKQDLAMRDALTGRGYTSYDEPSEEERQELKELIRSYLHGDKTVDDLPTRNIQQIKELFRLFKDVHHEDNAKASVLSRSNHAPADHHQHHQYSNGFNPSNNAEIAANDSHNANNDKLVGEAEETEGINIGVAPAEAAPQSLEVRKDVGAHHAKRNEQEQSPRSPRGQLEAGTERTLRVTDDKAELFEEYKRGAGKEAWEELRGKQKQLRDVKGKLREAAIAANETKREIDDLSQRASSIKGRSAGSGVVDAEEYDILQQLRSRKEAYRQHHDEVRRLKSEAEPLEQSVHHLRRSFVFNFEKWLSSATMLPTASSGPSFDQPVASDPSISQAAKVQGPLSRSPFLFFPASWMPV